MSAVDSELDEVMRRVLVRLVVYIGLLTFGLYVGHEWEGWLRFLLRGEPRMYVTTADIPIDNDRHGSMTNHECGPRSLGGIKAGTPVILRHVGPINTYTVEFETLQMQPPLREVSDAEAVGLKKQLYCP
jgi:hypothetical protein